MIFQLSHLSRSGTLRRTVLAACFLLAFSQFAVAAPYLLSDLIAGTSGTDGLGNIVLGDKTFSGWSYSSIGPDMPGAANVTVQAQLIAGNIGLEFLGSWHANPGNGLETAIINYLVTTTGGWLISDVHLDGDPTVNGGNGQVQVLESVSDPANHNTVLLNTLSIYDIVSGTSRTTRLNDFLFTNPQLPSLFIEKTIMASSDSPTTVAGVLHIQQSFSQVPEPGSLAMIVTGLGLIGIGIRRRR